MNKIENIIMIIILVVVLVLGIICCANSIKLNDKVDKMGAEVNKIKNATVWEEDYDDEDEVEYFEEEGYDDEEDESDIVTEEDIEADGEGDVEMVESEENEEE